MLELPKLAKDTNYRSSRLEPTSKMYANKHTNKQVYKFAIIKKHTHKLLIDQPERNTHNLSFKLFLSLSLHFRLI